MGRFPAPSRRAFLIRAAALGAAAFLRPAFASAIVRPRFKSYPFTLALRAVETVKRPEASIATVATFHVADGRPGPVRS